MKAMGFEKQVQLTKENKCPSCAKEVDKNEFRDDISLKEYSISGFCQKCQDSIWGK